MERGVRLGARLFSLGFITRRPLERVVTHPATTDVRSSVTTFCVEW